jgi:hypothetical protein
MRSNSEFIFNYHAQKCRIHSSLFSRYRQKMLRSTIEETMKLFECDLQAAVRFMQECVLEVAESKWHMGENHERVKHNSIENVFADKSYPAWVERVVDAEKKWDRMLAT